MKENNIKTKTNIKKIVLGAFGLLGVGLIAASGVVSAYQGDPTKEGPNYDADLHDLKTEAFDNVDYEVWKDLMEQSGNQGRVLEIVNAENFNIFVEAHNAAMEGDMEKSAELRAELGLNNGEGPRDGTGYRNGGEGKGQGSGNGSGQGQRMQQANFVDANGDGTCDNTGTNSGSQNKGQGRR